MLFSVEERLDDIKYNIDFGGRGTEGEGIGMSTMQNGAILLKCVNTFVPHFSVTAIVNNALGMSNVFGTLLLCNLAFFNCCTLSKQHCIVQCKKSAMQS